MPKDMVVDSSLDAGTDKTDGIFNVFPGHAVSYWSFRLSNSHVHVVSAARSSLSRTRSERNSLNATQISSVGGGAGSTLNSTNACSNAFAFFWPTLVGNFIFIDRGDTPVPRKSVNFIPLPALSTAFFRMRKCTFKWISKSIEIKREYKWLLHLHWQQNQHVTVALDSAPSSCSISYLAYVSWSVFVVFRPAVMQFMIMINTLIYSKWF